MSNDGFLALWKNLVGGSHPLPMSTERYPGVTEAVLQRRFLTIVTMKQPTSGTAPSRPNGCSAGEQALLMALFPSPLDRQETTAGSPVHGLVHERLRFHSEIVVASVGYPSFREILLLFPPRYRRSGAAFDAKTLWFELPVKTIGNHTPLNEGRLETDRAFERE